MFQTLKNKIKEWLGKMFNKNIIENKAKVDIAVSNEMSNSIDLWTSIYEDTPPWINAKKGIYSMNLGAGIASELARLVTLEFKSEISNNDFLNKEYQVVVDNIRNYTEFAAAKGGLAFKPYVSDGHIEVDLVQADAFYPTSYNSRGEITGAVFIETKTEGEHTYTRLEYHNLAKEGYLIKNTAYKKQNFNQMATNVDQTLGDEIELTEVEEWSQLEPEVTIKNIDKPLFSYFKMPLANTIDNSSPLGVSVYARAVKLIEQADKQYSRCVWEYESKEAAIDIDVTLIAKDEYGNDKIPEGKERLFRRLDIDSNSQGTSQYNVYSPEIRDTSMFNGLDQLLKRIEFLCGLAVGTISNHNVGVTGEAKTATEIKASKQRSYQQVKDIQKSLKNALDGLIYAMSVYGQLYGLGVKPVNLETDVSYDFDDSIIVDKDEQMNQLYLDTTGGLIKPSYYLKKRYNVSDEELKEMMNDTANTVTDDNLSGNLNPSTGLPN